MDVTRLAPSPTGALHLGNARTFLINWLLARKNGWRIVLRIDDLDGPRVKHNAAEQAMRDLRWLGLDWDTGPAFQSNRGESYCAAVNQLLEIGAAYPCVCSRTEVDRAASAPHAEDGSSIYPGTCRGKFKSIADAIAKTGRQPAIRFAVPPDSVVEWVDAFAASQRYDVARQLGDFVIAKADGTAAYQLAVVMDDADAGVTQIVRGDDLLDSTPRQMLVYRALDLTSQIPMYTHLPLVVGADGRRLAKRHGDTRLASFREKGVPAGKILKLLARSSGIEMEKIQTAGDLIQRFELKTVSQATITFSDAECARLHA